MEEMGLTIWGSHLSYVDLVVGDGNNLDDHADLSKILKAQRFKEAGRKFNPL